MLLKWMVCTVAPDRRAAFDAAQQQWAPIAHCDGLVGQVGGWDQHGRACILGAWRDAAALAAFMAHAHDAITEASDQGATHDHMAVLRLPRLLRMPGAARRFGDALAQAAFLRVADCTVPAARRTHFVGAQLRVWAPGMARCPGMLGGAFSGAVDPAALAAPTARYLVTTLWGTAADHQAYVDGPFAGLRAAAAAGADLAAITGHRVTLEPGWRVVPSLG